ncbi:MAG: Fe-S cluster assembly scaffold protein NifU [Acidobacteriota bacterium]
MPYSSEVKRLLGSLAHRGSLADSTHVAQRENPVCGDRIRLELKIEGGRVASVGYLAEGCPAALAAAEGLAELIEGRLLEGVQKVDAPTLLAYLGGLPAHKRHGADLAAEVLRAALTEPDKKA